MMTDPRHGLLQQIRALEFMAVELNLYLNTHPYDRRALEDYNRYTGQLMALREEYRRMRGVMTNFGYECSGYPWSWVNEPWPWEENY